MSLKKWDIIHGLSVLGGLIIFHLTGSRWPVLAISLLSLVSLWASQWSTISHMKPAGGYANLVTLCRYLLVLLIVALSGLWSQRITGLLFILPMMLDGFDGFLARRMGQVSGFGVHFDLETDSLFVALSGMLLFSMRLADVWILPAAYIRFIYVLALTVLRLNHIPERRTRFGPYIAVFMFFSLIAGFIYPSLPVSIMLMVAAGMVILSFGYSFADVLSRRHT